MTWSTCHKHRMGQGKNLSPRQELNLWPSVHRSHALTTKLRRTSAVYETLLCQIMVNKNVHCSIRFRLQFSSFYTITFQRTTNNARDKSINQSINQPSNQSTNQSINQSTNQSVVQATSKSINLRFLAKHEKHQWAVRNLYTELNRLTTVICSNNTGRLYCVIELKVKAIKWLTPWFRWLCNWANCRYWKVSAPKLRGS